MIGGQTVEVRLWSAFDDSCQQGIDDARRKAVWQARHIYRKVEEK
jgi:hypothetical protein